MYPWSMAGVLARSGAFSTAAVIFCSADSLLRKFPPIQ